MRVLITGITGFVGGHLAELLLADGGVELHGLARRAEIPSTLDHLRGHVCLWRADLRDRNRVEEVVDRVAPAIIFHLAGEGPGAEPVDLLRTNLEGSLHLLGAARRLNPNPRVHVAGSSAQYGNGPGDGLPIPETASFRPVNLYGVSKVGQEVLALHYWDTWRLPVIVTRAFNHTGPREPDSRVCPGFARQLAEIEQGLREPVMAVGNLDARRDFCDVRDVVHAYWLLAREGRPGEVYNVASGMAVTIGEVLEKLLRLSRVRPAVRMDPARLRPDEIPVQRGDATKCHVATGWVQSYGLDETLRDLLAYWRSVVAASPPLDPEQGVP